MTDTNRRNFNKLLGAGIVAIPVASLFSARTHAADKLDPESAIAQGLQFTVETTEAGKQCSGCQLYTAKDDASGACSIFSGQLVPAKGWCTAYTPKPA